jgi:phosphatidylglycerophosphatase A
MNPKIPPTLPFWHPAFLIATWFGAGLLPKISGTWGSAAALPFAWAIAWWGGPWVLLFASLAAFVIGIWAAGVFSAHAGVKDASPIVIDEVAGQWLTLFLLPVNPVAYLIGFFFFRLFDILKPWPANWADRELPGGLGVMLDDMIAGVYAAIATILAYEAVSRTLLH